VQFQSDLKINWLEIEVEHDPVPHTAGDANDNVALSIVLHNSQSCVEIVDAANSSRHRHKPRLQSSTALLTVRN